MTRARHRSALSGRTRPPISVALVGLVTLLTAATGLTLGALAWREKLAGSRALVDHAMAQAARTTADHAAAFLRHAETVARLGPSLVARGLLAPGDSRAVAEYALAVLRTNPQLSWVSYGDRDDRFIGAWRDGAGHLYLNRSFPRGGRIRLEEDRVLADGRRERIRTLDDHGYRPREQACPHRGTINEFIGDAILVLFGAPFERPDDAERAVRCAWAMQQAMGGFNAESRAQGLPELVMGIAVHSGRVVAGNIGSQDRMKYGVVGPAVNLAGRIESLTVGPQVLLSAATLERVAHVVSVGPPSQVAVKGMPEPVTVHELRGVAGEDALSESDARGAEAEVDLPAVAHVVDGKRVDETPHAVRVTRIGSGAVELVVEKGIPSTQLDLKLFLDFGDGTAGAGSYVRIAARAPVDEAGPARTRLRAVFTSLAEADRSRIERLLERSVAGSGPA